MTPGEERRSIARRARALLLATAIALLPGAAPAQADDVLGGFEDDEDFEVDIEFDTTSTDEADRWWNVDGSVGVSSSINWNGHRSAALSRRTDYGGLQRLRLRLNLELDARLPHDWKLRVSPHVWYDFAYLIHGRSSYTPQVIDDYEWEWEFQDTYVEGPLLENVDLKLGRQVVNWGRSDSVRVLDVLNPLDQREPARADIEDLARSVGMAKVDWYVDRNWTLTAIAIPEIRFSDTPPFGSDFNPSPVAPLPDVVPDDFEHWEAAASLRGIFEGWDVSLHYAHFYGDFPRQRLIGFAGPLPIFQGVHDPLHLVGAGGNYTFGSWLVKGEIAWTHGFEFDWVAAPGVAASSDDHSRLDAMLGIEYYGMTDNTFALEIVERHLFGHQAAFRALPNFVREDSMEWALRWSADWFNQKLSTTALAVLLGTKFQDGAIIRLQGDYEVAHGLTLTVGVLMFQAGDLPPLSEWGRNDRVFVDVKYAF